MESVVLTVDKGGVGWLCSDVRVLSEVHATSVFVEI